jgi:hypothetical protein
MLMINMDNIRREVIEGLMINHIIRQRELCRKQIVLFKEGMK